MLSRLANRNSPGYSDRFKPFMKLVRDHGYPIQKHFYKTEDDYINCAFRIPGPKSAEPSTSRPVIVLQHGMNDSCFFAMNEGTDSLALFFAEAGFDVWLNNTRGSFYSRHHKHLDPSEDQEFWNFSFQELGRYDQPAFIDYVRNETKQEQVTYLGHSQGGSQILSGLHENAQFFKDRVNLFLLLGPATRLDRCLHGDNLPKLCHLNEISPSLVQNPLPFGPRFSKMTAPIPFEKVFLKYICDTDPSKCSELGLHNVGGHYQAGTSVRCITHYRQIFESKCFQLFDFGDQEKNMAEYGQDGPPEIDLQAFSDVPIGLYVGKTDMFVSPGDYNWLREELIKERNCAYFREYDLGHLGLVIPEDKAIFYDLLALTNKFLDRSDQAKIIVKPHQVDPLKKAQFLLEQEMSQNNFKFAAL